MLKIECNLSAVPPETLIVAGLVLVVVVALGVILAAAVLTLFRVGVAPCGRAALACVWERWRGGGRVEEPELEDARV